MDERLRRYQREGAAFLKRRPRALLADEQGLGKSAQALSAPGSEDVTVVVACPSSVKAEWAYECGQWTPERNVNVIHSGKGPVLEGHVNVLSYDTAWRGAVRGHLNKLIPDVLILDEVHMLKNRSAKRTKVFFSPGALADVSDKSGEYIMVALSPASGKDTANTLASVYGRKADTYANWAARGKLVYARVAEELKSLVGVGFRSGGRASDPATITGETRPQPDKGIGHRNNRRPTSALLKRIIEDVAKGRKTGQLT